MGEKIIFPELGKDPESSVRVNLTKSVLSEISKIKSLGHLTVETADRHLFNSRQLQIPFLGCRAVNESVKFIDVVRTTQHV